MREAIRKLKDSESYRWVHTGVQRGSTAEIAAEIGDGTGNAFVTGGL